MRSERREVEGEEGEDVRNTKAVAPLVCLVTSEYIGVYDTGHLPLPSTCNTSPRSTYSIADGTSLVCCLEAPEEFGPCLLRGLPPGHYGRMSTSTEEPVHLTQSNGTSLLTVQLLKHLK